MNLNKRTNKTTIPTTTATSSSSTTTDNDGADADEGKDQPSSQSTLFHDAHSRTLSSTKGLISEEALKRHQATSQLLEEIDGNHGDDNLSTKMSLWFQQATNLFRDEILPARPRNGATITSSGSNAFKRTSSPGNIIERRHKLDTSQNTTASSTPQTNPRVTDATDTICSFPNCIQSLNIAVSRFHCRKCNGWYCARHAGHPSLGMRLDPRTGEADPQRGVWSRVCQRCFAERFYVGAAATTIVPERDLTIGFQRRRADALQELKEEYRQLEGRWRRLSEFPKKSTETFRRWEQTVVKWEEDESVTRCRICQEAFSAINRRHHCRLCGRIICGEPECSLLKPLKFTRGGSTELRICTDCERHLFGRQIQFLKLPRAGADERADPLIALHLRLQHIKNQVADIMPQFNQQLLRLEHEIYSPNPDVDRADVAMAEAKTARRTLLLLFDHYREATAALSSHLAHGEDERRLVRNIQQEATFYLQNNMFTLQMLPRLDRARLQQRRRQQQLKQEQLESTFRRAESVASTTRRGPESIRSMSGTINRMTDFLYRSLSLGSISGASGGMGPSPYGPLSIPPPANLHALRQKGDVLMEHKEQLEGFLTDAVQENRFEEVRSLRLALQQVNSELYHLQRTLSQFANIQGQGESDDLSTIHDD